MNRHCQETTLIMTCDIYDMQSIRQEIIFAQLMETDINGESILRTIKVFFLKRDIQNVLSSTTDDTPAMICKYRGFMGP